MAICHQAWLPDNEPRAIMLLVHGLAEHCGRYTNLVERAVPRGLGVCSLDHVGHGRSDGPRTYVDRFADYTDTLETHLSMVRHQYPDAPVFLVGHSMGALIAADFLFDHQNAFAGAILSGSLVKVPDNISPFTVLISRIISSWLPRLRLVGVDASGVSRDPDVVRAYIDDPLVFNGKTTARLGHEILKAMDRVCSEAPAIKLPILILHGEADRLASVEGSCQLHESVSSSDKTLRVYDGLHHEIYNEPEHPQVLGDVIEWIEARLPSQTA